MDINIYLIIFCIGMLVLMWILVILILYRLKSEYDYRLAYIEQLLKIEYI